MKVARRAAYRWAGVIGLLAWAAGALAAALTVLPVASRAAGEGPAAAPPAPPGAMPPKKICILFSRDLAPYRDAVEGFKERMQQTGNHRFVELAVVATEVGRLMDQVKAAKPDLILSLGTEASKVAAVHAESTPVLFAMVANPVDSGVLPRRPYPDQLVAGVTTDVSAKTQFETLRQIVPGAARVAVIYCPQYTEATVSAAEVQARAMGIDLVRLAVEPYRVDPAIERIEKEPVDALWTLTDPGVMVPASAKRILTSALKAKIPVVGFSPAMVRAGALVGLGIDSKAIGEQVADMAIGVLRDGKKPADFHLVYPEKTSVHINAGVAERLGVALPQAVVAGAQMVQGQ